MKDGKTYREGRRYVFRPVLDKTPFQTDLTKLRYEKMGLEELNRIADERQCAVRGAPSDATADYIKIVNLEAELKRTKEQLAAAEARLAIISAGINYVVHRHRCDTISCCNCAKAEAAIAAAKEGRDGSL